MDWNLGFYAATGLLLCTPATPGRAQVVSGPGSPQQVALPSAATPDGWPSGGGLPGFIRFAGLSPKLPGVLTLYEPIAGCKNGSCTGCGYDASDCVPVKEMGICVEGVDCFPKVEIVTISTYQPATPSGSDAGDSGTPTSVDGVSVENGATVRVAESGVVIASGTFTSQRQASTPKIAISNRVESVEAGKGRWALVFAPRWQFHKGHWSEVKRGSRVHPPSRLRLVESKLSKAEWKAAPAPREDGR